VVINVRCKSTTTRVRKKLGSPLFGAVSSLRQVTVDEKLKGEQS